MPKLALINELPDQFGKHIVCNLAVPPTYTVVIEGSVEILRQETYQPPDGLIAVTVADDADVQIGYEYDPDTNEFSQPTEE